MLDAKKIREKVTKELHAHFDSKWFKPGSTKLSVASNEKLTDFDIEISCYSDRRYGEYDCKIDVSFKWKKFSEMYSRFKEYFSEKYSQRNYKSINEFFIISFDSIYYYQWKQARDNFWVSSDDDLESFIAQSVADLDGKVGDWIKGWFTWPSALNAMDEHENLCGAWRETAYFCLLDQVKGREAACSWARGATLDRPILMAEQVEYLRSHFCSENRHA